MDELIRVLEKTVSPSQADQNEAVQYIEAYIQRDFAGFLKHLSDVLYNTTNQPVVRAAAGLQLKNQLTSRDESIKLIQQDKWRNLPQDVKIYIKERVFTALGTEIFRPSSAPQCVAYIAIIELPEQQWPGLIEALVQFVRAQESTDARRFSTLEAIGYICQDIDQTCLKPEEASGILTAIISGMQHNEKDVKLAATTALLNSLEFTEANFQNKQERDYIMTVVCQTTLCEDIKVRVAALQCLVKIMSLYYHVMEFYMGEALFRITMDAMKNENDEIALQGIEFWSNVCDEEIQLANEAQEARDLGRQPERLSKHYANSALIHLVPILIEMLGRQDETDDSEEWNPCKAAGVCLMLLANCCENAIVGHVLPFIRKDIESDDWKRRDAAIMTFGSILDGPDQVTLHPIAEQIVPFLIRFMKDTSVVVRDSAAWAIGKLCDTVPSSVLTPTLLDPLALALIENIGSETRVAANVCWAFNSLISAASTIAKGNSGSKNPPTFLLSKYFLKIVQELISATDRQEQARDHEFNLRNASYQALMTAIQCAPDDCYQIVYPNIFEFVMRRIVILNDMITANTAGPEMRSQLYENQALLWSTMQSLIRRMSRDEITKHCDDIMAQLLRSMSLCPDSPAVLEDSLMAVSKLIAVVGLHFERYINHFKPYLISCISSSLAPQLNTVALNILSDLSCYLPHQLFLSIDEYMNLLQQKLADENYDKQAKSLILSLFGDFGLSFGLQFEKWVKLCLEMLNQATQVTIPDRSDYEMIDYCMKLRENAVEGYIGLVQGMKVSNNPQSAQHQAVKRLLASYVPQILQFLLSVSHDPDITDDFLSSACGLIGDIADHLGSIEHVAAMLKNQQITDLLTRGKNTKSKKVHTIAGWALDQVLKLNS